MRITGPYRRAASSKDCKDNNQDDQFNESRCPANGMENAPLRLRGGVGFEFPAMNAGEKVRYYLKKPGLNLKGCCCNPLCDLFDKEVWSNVGFKHSLLPTRNVLTMNGFNIGALIHKAPCPACGEFLDHATVKACAFHHCSYAYEGYKIGRKGIQRGSGKSEKDDYELHDEVSKLSDWTTLTIGVRPRGYMKTVLGGTALGIGGCTLLGVTGFFGGYAYAAASLFL